ncbi:helix-turn-helix transcriptional regulator [Pararhizobium sp. DWP3-4]|jgi:prophage regulatory protein|uniref:helix-turn-helix transcriptional regulator n=1 Tax=Pararhizobium sp. DWP3-4 TaxID=2804565 RepID=UPI003CEFFDD1
MRLLSFKDLNVRGIPFSRQWLDKLIKAGRFPQPVKVGSRRVMWVEAEINQYLEELASHRDGAAA